MPASSPTELVAPLLLLAMPQVMDPFFHRSVILLLHHDEHGSFGFIVNKPTEVRIQEILVKMEIEWAGDRETPAYFGGPVEPQLGSVLFWPEPGGSGSDRGEELGEAAPGVRITRDLDDLVALARTPPRRLRLLLGYAGWSAGQLVAEILRNDWLTAPPVRHLLFSSPPEAAWSEALRSVGVDPAHLPAWTPPGGESSN